MTNTINICDEISQNFIDGSYDTNNNRAFPDIRDGLKPGQRACLWEMFTKKYFSSKPHVKSAKISGGVAAMWWPHGTTALYETFARMSMPYINNECEVDFHGSNGNQVLGADAIAADRYTEARLSKIVEEGMLKNIEKNNVDMMLNFSEDAEWPKVLPAVFPRLLVNGCQGIGVSIANHWTLHNFKETANLILKYIDTGIVDNDNYYPDFPTGGVIINPQDLPQINKTGKGKVIVDAAYEIVDNNIIIYELPYQVYVEPVIEKIKEAVDAEKITDIVNVINKCDKKELKLVIECVKGVDPQKVVNQLFSFTPLRSQYNVNQVGMVSKTPKLHNLQQVLDIYLDHNLNCILREYQFDYNKTKKRIDILKGMLIAINNIDEVIEIIRNDKNPSDTLKITFNLTDEQVKAITDMKLGRLSKLEKEKLEKELQEKEEYLALCESMINNIDNRKKCLKERLSKLAASYGHDRRTKIEQKDIVKISKAKAAKEKIVEDVVIEITENGYIKSIPITQYRQSKNIIMSVKTNTDDMIILFSNQGRIFRLAAKNIKKCSSSDKGTAFGAILKMEQNEKIIAASPVNAMTICDYIAFITKNGKIKKTKLTEYCGSTQNINGMKGMTLNNDEIVFADFGLEDNAVNITTTAGYGISFASDDVNYQGKTASGVKAINLSEGDTIASCSLGKAKYPIQRKGGKGKKY